MAVRNRGVRVSDGLPAVAEGEQRRPSVRAIPALAREQWSAHAGAAPKTLQDPHFQGSEDVPQVP